jgi:hypothetical protein
MSFVEFSVVCMTSLPRGEVALGDQGKKTTKRSVGKGEERKDQGHECRSVCIVGVDKDDGILSRKWSLSTCESCDLEH